MRIGLGLPPLFPQRQALVDTKTMLFINNYQGKLCERHFILKQGMGAHNHTDPMFANGLQGFPPLCCFESAGQPGHLDTQRCQPVTNIIKVLFAQYFGGRHQGYLIAGFNRL